MDRPNGDLHQIRDQIDHVLAVRPSLLDGVRTCVADALNIDRDLVGLDANLTQDLAAESLDYLDLIFRLERLFKVRIPRGGLIDAVRAGLGENPLDVHGKLTPEALARLRILMPEVDSSQIKDGLTTHGVSDLFTVMTFARLLAWQLEPVEQRAVS